MINGVQVVLLASIALGVFATSASASSLNYPSFFDCKGEDRYNWYCREEPKPEKEIEQPVEQQKPQAEVEKEPEKDPALVEFEEIQKELERRLQVAYVNPTEENITAYIEYQNYVTEKAAIFTDVWKRTQWQNPELDYSQRFPIASMAKKTNQSMIEGLKKQNFKDLIEQGYGVFFFYASNCSYCHQMEMPIKVFQSQTGMDVLPISIDRVLLEEKFPNSVPDSGQAESLGVTQTPSIFLVNTQTRDIQPVATGWVSVQELIDRIYILTATEPGGNF